MKVLLIDDDAIFVFLSTKLLEHMGVNTIYTASNGREALDLIIDLIEKSKPLPDYILVDINMPILNGFGFIEAFNQIEYGLLKQAELVIVSSSQDPRDVSKARDLQISHYLSKPVTEHSLRQVFEK